MVLWTAAAAESGWLGRRLLKSGNYEDRVALWVDTLFSVGGLAVCEAALVGGDGAPWMKNIAIGAALGAAATPNPVERAAAMTVLSSAAVVSGVNAKGRDAHVAGLALAVNDAISWWGMHGATRAYVAGHLRQARLRDEADALALQTAAAAAAESERSRQHILVHEGTIDALDALAASVDPHSAGAIARQEAARLRHVLRTRGEVPSDLDRSLYEITEASMAEGLRVELVTAELVAELRAEVVAAVANAVHASLLAAAELGDARRAVVRAASDSGTVTVTVRHHGKGFSAGSGSEYEMRLGVLPRLLANVGGTADVWSSEDGGVRVTFAVPMGESIGDGADLTIDSAPAEAPSEGLTTSGEAPPLDQEARRAERTILSAFMAWRLSGLATGLAALIAGRHRYRSLRAAIVQWLMAAGESAWLLRRLYRRRTTTSDRVAARVDAVSAVAVVAVGRATLATEDRWTWVNWAPWSFAAPAVCGQVIAGDDIGHSIVGAASISAAVGALSSRVTEVAATWGALGAFFAATRLFVRQIRGAAASLDAAHAAAVTEGTRLAADRERTRQLRLLHDSALQTLEAVASGRYPDLATIQARARSESARLRSELDDPRGHRGGFGEELRAVVDEHRAYLDIELYIGDVGQPGRQAAAALRDACGEALMNVRKHANVGSARVQVGPIGAGLQLTVEDDGDGFDPSVMAGFGITESIRQRLSDVGGEAEIISWPGRGTRIVLWAPA